MFNIEKLVIWNFKSFKDAHLFVFPTAPGLYRVVGNNLANPRLAANGAGKSTLFEAVRWCLTGRTSRGLKAADIITWGEKSSSVSVVCTVGTQTSTIKRSQSPNQLTLDGIVVEQSAIDKFIRLSPESFDYAVIAPQFGKSFFELGPEPKMALFGKILGLDYWLERSMAASALTNTLLAEKIALDNSLANLSGQHTMISRDIVVLTERADVWATQQENLIEDFKSKKQSALEARARQFNKLEELKKAAQAANARFIERQNETSEAQVLIDSFQPVHHAAIGAQATRKAIVKAVQAQLQALGGVGAVCDQCLQAVSAVHLKAQTKTLTKKVEDAKSSLMAANAALSEIEDKLYAAKQQSNKLLKEMTSARDERDNIDYELGDHQTTTANLQATVELLKNRIADELKRENPFVNQLFAKRDDLALLVRKIKSVKADLAQVNKDHAAASYWITGFKRVRLHIIDESLKQLEIEINNNLVSLGLLNWRISLDVERENKSGSITKGFSVMIHSPDHNEPARFETWSGGETQRLRLAGDLGLSNLIMQQAGLMSTFECYDEPSRHLSKEGLNDLIETLQDRALTQQKRIFFIDHVAFESAAFAGTITVTKDADGKSALV